MKIVPMLIKTTTSKVLVDLKNIENTGHLSPNATLSLSGQTSDALRYL